MGIVKMAENKRISHNKHNNPLDSLRRTVLVVDDQEINREILQEILKSKYEILTAENGAVALKTMREQHDRIAVVLLDITMPVLDGFAVLSQMKDDPELSKIPVLVITQGEGDEREIRALSLGAIDYLTKPYKPEVIQHKIANTIKLMESSQAVTVLEKDSLTKLYSKEFFYTYCERLLVENTQIDYDMICADLNGFTLINDLFGRVYGDEILRAVASSIQDPVHSLNGLACRLRADKFMIMIPRRNDYDKFLPKLFGDFEKNTKLPFNLTLRYGIFAITDRKLPVETMCDRAVIANNTAKGYYDTILAYYDDSMRQKIIDEQFLTNEARAGLKENQFEVYLQPKYEIRTNRIAGAEALIRWNHPVRGFMPPGAFIPLFEKNGMVFELDRFVWNDTCRLIQAWKKKYGSCVPISVNVSRADIYSPNLSSYLTEMVKKHGLKPEDIHFEITESVYTQDSGTLINVVEKLRDSGFKIEMDDFGSGYSSLNALSSMPLDLLKLDMRFMREVSEDPRKSGILKFIMELAEVIHVPVIAEGVETEDQLNRLRSVNCQYAQGYYYAKPMKAADFEKLQYAGDKKPAAE